MALGYDNNAAGNGSLPGEDRRTFAGVPRLCGECGVAFLATHKAHKMCSPKCRVRKSRRLAAGKSVDPEQHAKAQARMAEAERLADEGALAIAQDVIRQELTPVIREHLTEGIMRSIGELVDLTPLMVAALKDDLTAQELVLDDKFHPILDDDNMPMYRVDKARRQRAVAIVAKYTIGSPGLAPQADSKPQPISVNFGGMPRPDWDAEEPERECDTCREFKAEDEFENDSPRCRECQAKIKDRALDLIEERVDAGRSPAADE